MVNVIAPFRFALAFHTGAEAYVFAHGHPLKQRTLLKDHAALGIGACDQMIVEGHRALCRGKKSGDDVEKRCLATARGAKDAHQFACFDFEGNVFECLNMAAVWQVKAHGDFIDGESGHARLSGPQAPVVSS